MEFYVWCLYLVTVIFSMTAVYVKASERGDFPKNMPDRLKVLAVTLVPVLNLVYGVMIIAFY